MPVCVDPMQCMPAPLGVCVQGVSSVCRLHRCLLYGVFCMGVGAGLGGGVFCIWSLLCAGLCGIIIMNFVILSFDKHTAIWYSLYS